jgi:hypothetical protein
VQAADAYRYAAIVNSNLAMKIGPGSWSPGAGWTLAASGNDRRVRQRLGGLDEVATAHGRPRDEKALHRTPMQALRSSWMGATDGRR